ncbi:unnamed protein product [Aphanomyces euteiches]
MANFCRECGAAPLGRRFCSQCGKETAASASSIPAATSLGDPNPQSTLKRAGSVEIPPVAVGDEATTIYKRVVATVRGTHHGEQADNTVKDFKKDCKQYGAGAISAEAFEANLRVYLGEYMIDATMPQLVRLIHDDDKRAELVMVYHRQSKNKTKSRPASASSAVQRSTNLPPSSQLTVATPVEPPRSEGQARPPAKWSAPSLYTNQPVCDICSTPFDMMNRRHHCRKCGKSACQSCSPAHMLIPPGHQHAQAKGYDPAVPQRVCTLCAPVLQPLQARLEAAFANCHKEQPAAPTKGWFKSIPVKQTIEDECEMAQKMLRQFFLTSQVDKQIPITFLERAHGLAFLTVVKAGLLVTAKMGSGIVLTKFPDKTWSAPSAIGTAGLGGGFEGGGELVQILLLLGSAKAVSVFYQTQLTLGAGLDVTVGPYGRSATAQAAMSSSGGGLDVNYSYSHSRGLFAGISLHGAVINCRSDANRAFYGRHVTPMEILTGAVAPPRAAQGLYDAIEEAVQSCASFRDDQRTRQQRVCTQAGCPCEKFRAKTLSAKCANCGHSH